MASRSAHPGLAHPVFRGVSLTETDAPAGLLLSTEAGWNQTNADWRLLLGAGTGLGFEDEAGTLVASAVLFPYGDRFAWIGMVLVSATARRQKLATLLMARLLALAAERRWLPLLDATADGRTVYLPLGFRDLRTITRWHRPAGLPALPSRRSTTFAVEPMAESAPWAEWDAWRFGADRSRLLEELQRAQPGLAVQARSPSGQFEGYALTRAGRAATQVGPIVTESSAGAATLIDEVVTRMREPLLLDLVDGDPALEAHLRAHGFEPRRHFVRMIHGSAAEPGRPAAIRAIAGPEFG